MSKTINYLNKEHLDKYWNIISPLLEKGLLYSEGEINIHQLRLLVVQGTAHIIIASSNLGIIGAAAVEVIKYPNYRAANIISLGGEHLFSCKEDLEEFKNLLKTVGISKIQGWCKPAQARFFSSTLGFKTPYQMISMDIGD